MMSRTRCITRADAPTEQDCWQVVSTQNGESIAKANQMQFFTTSAKEDPDSTMVAINKLVESIKQRKYPGVKIEASSALKEIAKSPEQAPEDIGTPDKALSQLPEVPRSIKRTFYEMISFLC